MTSTITGLRLVRRPPGEPAETPVPAGGRGRVAGFEPLATVATALALIAVLSAGWFGWSYYDAAHSDSLAYSRLRDEVLRSGEQAIVNLSTLDYRSLDQGLKTWQDSTTAELYGQIVQGRPQLERELAKARTVSTAKIEEAVLAELDARAGKAAIIAAVRITVAARGGQPAVKSVRLSGQLTKTTAGWKLSALGQARANGS